MDEPPSEIMVVLTDDIKQELLDTILERYPGAAPKPSNVAAIERDLRQSIVSGTRVFYSYDSGKMVIEGVRDPPAGSNITQPFSAVYVSDDANDNAAAQNNAM